MPKVTQTGKGRRGGRKNRSATGNQASARRFDSRRRWRLLRRGALVFTALVLLLGGILAVKFHYIDRGLEKVAALALDKSASAGFVVHNRVVSGQHYLPRKAVLKALGVAPGSAIFALDLEAARRRLESLGWVRSAVVRRRLPDTLEVSIVERVPFVRWQHKRATRLVDRDGTVIGRAAGGGFDRLPLVVGSGAPAAAPSLLEILRRTPLFGENLRAAVRIGGRRWDIYLKDGTVLRLPGQLGASRLQKIAATWKAMPRGGRRKGTYDFRFDDRVIAVAVGDQR